MDNSKTNNNEISPSIANFIVIDNSLFLDKRLNFSDIVTYGLIQGLSNNDNRACYCNNRYLSKILNISIRQVQICLSRLKKFKYITIDIKNNNKRIIKTDINNFINKRDEVNKIDLEDFNWLN